MNFLQGVLLHIKDMDSKDLFIADMILITGESCPFMTRVKG